MKSIEKREVYKKLLSSSVNVFCLIREILTPNKMKKREIMKDYNELNLNRNYKLNQNNW